MDENDRALDTHKFGFGPTIGRQRASVVTLLSPPFYSNLSHKMRLVYSKNLIYLMPHSNAQFLAI
jgi:hypothetical protein